MNRRALVVGGVVVVGVALVGAVTYGRSLGSQPPAVTYLTATATVTDVVDTVAVTGSVQPVETYGLAFGQAATRNPKPSLSTSAVPPAQTWTVEAVNVKAGDPVEAGSVLATANSADAEAALATATLNLDAAKARLAADAKPVTANATAKARLGVTQANRQLAQARTAQTQTAASGRLAISQASAVLADARSRLAADQAAHLPDTIIAADQAAVKQASRALASTRLQVASANTQASNQVALASLGVQSATLGYQGTTTVNTSAIVAADKAAVSQAEQAVSDAQTVLDRMTLTAPIAGTVSAVSIQPGDVTSGTVIVLRGQAVEIGASVTESDLPAIKVGQPADVRITALDASVKGTVDAVDLAGATKSAGGVVSYGITISLPIAPPNIAPSMTADVDITTASAPSVLAVPATAIAGTPGAYTVQVLDASGAVSTVPVGVGLMTTSLAELKSGIAAGTVVVTGVATAKDLVTTFPTGPGGQGGTRTPAPAASGQ